MKRFRTITTLLFVLVSGRLFAQSDLQNQLVGTWELSWHTLNGNNWDMTKAKLYKVVTPSHWMVVSLDPETKEVDGNSGSYTLTGNKYIETVPYGRTEYTVKVEGDTYYQDGFIYLKNGKTLELHEVYRRIKEPAGQNKDIAGTWELVSTHQVKEGNKEPLANMSELFVITPGYYMYVSKKSNKFYQAEVGTYKKESNKIVPTPLITSARPGSNEKVKLTFARKGNELTINGTAHASTGEKTEWVSVYQEAAKSENKTASTAR